MCLATAGVTLLPNLSGNHQRRLLGRWAWARARRSIAHYEAIEPSERPRKDVAYVGGRLRKAVALSAIANILSGLALLVERAEELLGLSLITAHISLAVDNKERRRDLLGEG